jgi:hypothetical protein
MFQDITRIWIGIDAGWRGAGIERAGEHHFSGAAATLERES